MVNPYFTTFLAYRISVLIVSTLSLMHQYYWCDPVLSLLRDRIIGEVSIPNQVQFTKEKRYARATGSYLIPCAFSFSWNENPDEQAIIAVRKCSWRLNLEILDTFLHECWTVSRFQRRTVFSRRIRSRAGCLSRPKPSSVMMAFFLLFVLQILLAIVPFGTALGQMRHDWNFRPDYTLRITSENITVACRVRLSTVVNGMSSQPNPI